MNLKTKLEFIATPLLALTCLSATAAEDAELKVFGTIVPAACELTFPGGSETDFGKIDGSTLSPTDFTPLPEQLIGFAIICDAPMAAGVNVVNNKPFAGLPTGIGQALGLGPAPEAAYPFAISDGQQVGGYALWSDALTADGAAVVHIARRFTGPWTNGTYKVFSYFNGVAGNYHGFAAPGTSVPIAFTALTGNIRITAALNKAGALTLTDETPIDGSATVRISYY